MQFESMVEETIIGYLERLDYEFLNDSNEWLQNRDLDQFINDDLLRESIIKINKISDDDIIDEAIKKIKNIEYPSLFDKNRQFHKYLIDGITIDSKKYKVNPTIRLIDFENVNKNVFQVVHQVTYKEGNLTQARRPDVVIYVNGIPLVIMELKSFDVDSESATLENAYAQLVIAESCIVS